MGNNSTKFSFLFQILVISRSESLGVGYLYGGIQSPNSYLNMRTTSTGSTVCFVQGYPFWFGTMLPYALAMVTVILTYLFQTYLICTNVSTDKMKVDQQKEIMKKLFMVFFSIGVCWLFLILAIAVPMQNKVFDVIFIVLKGVQGVIVLVFLYGSHLKTQFRNLIEYRPKILEKFKQEDEEDYSNHFNDD